MEKSLQVLVGSELHMRLQYALEAKMAKNTLGCINRSVASRSRETINPPTQHLLDDI